MHCLFYINMKDINIFGVLWPAIVILFWKQVNTFLKLIHSQYC